MCCRSNDRFRAVPQPGDLRAWDELLRGVVRIGGRIGRAMNAKLRDSGADRMILLRALNRSSSLACPSSRSGSPVG